MNENKPGDIIPILIFFLFAAVALSLPYWMEPISPVAEQSPPPRVTTPTAPVVTEPLPPPTPVVEPLIAPPMVVEQLPSSPPIPAVVEPLMLTPPITNQPIGGAVTGQAEGVGPDLGMFPAAHPRVDAVKPLSPVVEQSSPPPVPAVAEPPVLTPPPSPQGAAPSAAPPAPPAAVKPPRRVSIEQFRKEAADLDLGE